MIQQRECFGKYSGVMSKTRGCMGCGHGKDCIPPIEELTMVGDVKRADQEASKRAQDFLQAALGHMQGRAKTYDKPQGERSMGAAVAAFNAATGHALSETQGWIFMVFLKAIRSQQGAFRADNFEDMAAYAGLAGESAIRAKEMGQ